MPSQNATKTGSCLCGAVRFEVSGPLKPVVGCHCTMCRKQTSHYLAFTAAWLEDFNLVQQESLKWFRSSADSRRGFCGDCGSILFFATDGDAKISIAAGSFDGDTGLATAAHIFVGDKGDYYELTDGAQQHVQGGDKVPMPPRNPVV